MFPVYYFETLPETLPDDDVCYIISKYIYLKKRVGLVDSLVKVDSIDMGTTITEYARMNLPKIKAPKFGAILGFFKMTYEEYKSEAGTILNLHTHRQKTNLKKVDFTVPHQRVSNGGCKYEIVIDPNYVNCGTVHSHADFSAFHSGTDINDERYFDGLHITVGHVNSDKFSISACVVVNGKRVRVDPRQYIEGIKKVSKENDSIRLTSRETEYYTFDYPDLIVKDRKYLNRVTPTYPCLKYCTADDRQEQLELEWGNWSRSGDILDIDPSPVAPCVECIFKEVRIDQLYDELDEEEIDLFSEKDKDIMEKTSATDLLFGVGGIDLENDDPRLDVEDGLFEKTHIKFDSTPIFEVGEVDENDITRKNNSLTKLQFEAYKKAALKRHIKCDCETTFFVPDPMESSVCPNCEKEHAAKTFTLQDALKMHNETRVTSGKL